MLKDEAGMSKGKPDQHSSVIVLKIDEVLKQIGIPEAKWRSYIKQANAVVQHGSEK